MKRHDIDDKAQIAFNHAVNFYNSNNRGVDNQRLCIQQMMKLTGFNFDTCVKIQSPVLSLYMASETISLGRQVVQEQLGIVTGLVRSHLLSIQSKIQPETKESKDTGLCSHNYSTASQEDIDKHFVAAYDSSDGRLDIDGFYQAGNRAIGRTVEHLRYQVTQRDAKNGTGHKVLKHKHTLNFSFNSMSDQQAQHLAEFLSWQELNLAELNLSSNNITCRGVESLFWGLRVSPDHLPHAHIRSHNLRYINLSDNQIGDPGAEYIAQSLISGRYPNLKGVDASGNGITETGQGYFARALDEINQSIAIVFTKVQEISKQAFKQTIKSMLYIAKQNGISTKEMLTTDETIEHCKKGTFNVAKNIIGGVVKCTEAPVKYFTPKELILQDVLIDVLALAVPEVGAVLTYTCISEKVVFSVVDEDFGNCLVGVESILND